MGVELIGLELLNIEVGVVTLGEATLCALGVVIPLVVGVVSPRVTVGTAFTPLVIV